MALTGQRRLPGTARPFPEETGRLLLGGNLTRVVHYATLRVPPPPGGGDRGQRMSSDEYTLSIVNRLKSIEGHVRGIQRMLEEGAYCMDIINQNLAVQRALEKVNSLILERHLQTCVTTAIRSDNPAERERVIDEILSVFETTGKM